VPARPEEVERLPVLEEEGLLRLADDELGACVEVLDWGLPDEGAAVALVLDYIEDGHVLPPFVVWCFSGTLCCGFVKV